MKPTTVFAIKANLAALLMMFLIALLFGLAFRPLMENVVFAGIASIAFAFAGTLIAMRALLKNSKLTPADRDEALTMTWKLAVAIGAVLFLMDAKAQLAKGALWTTFSLLSIAAQVAAVRMVAKK